VVRWFWMGFRLLWLLLIFLMVVIVMLLIEVIGCRYVLIEWCIICEWVWF